MPTSHRPSPTTSNIGTLHPIQQDLVCPFQPPPTHQYPPPRRHQFRRQQRIDRYTKQTRLLTFTSQRNEVIQHCTVHVGVGVRCLVALVVDEELFARTGTAKVGAFAEVFLDGIEVGGATSMAVRSGLYTKGFCVEDLIGLQGGSFYMCSKTLCDVGSSKMC
jgi:hypothetical protein